VDGQLATSAETGQCRGKRDQGIHLDDGDGALCDGEAPDRPSNCEHRHVGVERADRDGPCVDDIRPLPRLVERGRQIDAVALRQREREDGIAPIRQQVHGHDEQCDGRRHRTMDFHQLESARDMGPPVPGDRSDPDGWDQLDEHQPPVAYEQQHPVDDRFERVTGEGQREQRAVVLAGTLEQSRDVGRISGGRCPAQEFELSQENGTGASLVVLHGAPPGRAGSIGPSGSPDAASPNGSPRVHRGCNGHHFGWILVRDA
jgi:hypothetical protein